MCIPPCSGQSQAEPNVSCPLTSQEAENHDILLVKKFTRNRMKEREIGERKRERKEEKELEINHTLISIQFKLISIQIYLNTYIYIT